MTPREPGLPDHSIRESRRAVHVHLRFSLRGGLEVVVPPGFDRSEIPGLLREKTRWIERTRRELDAQRLLLDPWPHDRIPERIELQAIGETWTVETVPAEASRVSVRELDGRRVLLSGPFGDAERWRAALKRWLARKAQTASRRLGRARSRRSPPATRIGVHSLAEEPLGKLLAPRRPSGRIHPSVGRTDLVAQRRAPLPAAAPRPLRHSPRALPHRADGSFPGVLDETGTDRAASARTSRGVALGVALRPLVARSAACTHRFLDSRWTVDSGSWRT